MRNAINLRVPGMYFVSRTIPTTPSPAVALFSPFSYFFSCCCCFFCYYCCFFLYCALPSSSLLIAVLSCCSLLPPYLEPHLLRHLSNKFQDLCNICVDSTTHPPIHTHTDRQTYTPTQLSCLIPLPIDAHIKSQPVQIFN